MVVPGIISLLIPPSLRLAVDFTGGTLWEVQFTQQMEQFAAPLRERFGQFTELRFESVGPAVGQEIAARAVMGVALAALGILLYIVWAFRKIENPIRYGVCAITSVIVTGFLVLGV